MIFDIQQSEWSRPPIGGVNTPNSRLSFMSDEEVREWVELTWPKQYGEPSNWKGLYREGLGLDSTHNKTVLDFGSGFGFDALSFARNGCEVLLADIVPGNLIAATRVLTAHGYLPREIIKLTDVAGEFDCAVLVDVFYSAGVLHHMPIDQARQVLRTAHFNSAPDGVARLMLYTEYMWYQATSEKLPSVEYDQSTHPRFQDYTRFCDAVGFHAEWYNEERVKLLIKDTGWMLHAWEYIRHDNAYGVAILQKE